MQIHYRNVLFLVCLNCFVSPPLHLGVALEIFVTDVPNRFILSRFSDRTSLRQIVLLFPLKKWEYSDTSANEDNSFRNHIR